MRKIALVASRNWHRIELAPKEIALDVNLNNGQSFRWRCIGNSEWRSVIGKYVVSLRHAHSGNVEFCLHQPIGEEDGASVKTAESPVDCMRKHLEHYFAVDISLEKLYSQWKQDDAFARIADSFSGVRILQIDPIECLFSFICSSNNNIVRIAQMVEKLATEYGDYIGSIGDEDMYAFPEPARLINSEKRLRELGFGYRAKYIDQTARLLHDQHACPRAFLSSLTAPTSTYENARNALLQFPGVGPKVADCVCLMALGHAQVVPVDTHVRQIAAKHFGVRNALSSATPAVTAAIQQAFETRYGTYAGWAHAVLFSADLKRFEDRGHPKKGKRKSEHIDNDAGAR